MSAMNKINDAAFANNSEISNNKEIEMTNKNTVTLFIEERHSESTGELFAVRLTPSNATGEVVKLWEGADFEIRKAVLRAYIAAGIRGLFDNPLTDPEKGLLVFANGGSKSGFGYAYRYSGSLGIKRSETVTLITELRGFYQSHDLVNDGEFVSDHARNQFYQAAFAFDFFDGITYDINIPNFLLSYFEKVLQTAKLDSREREQAISGAVTARLDDKAAYRNAKGKLNQIMVEADGEVEVINKNVKEVVHGFRIPYYREDGESVLFSKVRDGRYTMRFPETMAEIEVVVGAERDLAAMKLQFLVKKGYQMIRNEMIRNEQ